MARRIDYLPFATAVGSNVDTQDAYLNSGYQTQGFMNGVAWPYQFNKVLRQASVIIAAIATFISNMLNIDLIDDGVLTTLVANFTRAVRQASFGHILIAYAPAAVIDATQGVSFEFMLTGNMAPSLLNLSPGQPLTFIIRQDPVGGHTFTAPAGLPLADISLTANDTSIQTFRVLNDGVTIVPTSSPITYP